MIDTITLCLHDLKKHESILNSIRIINNGFRKFEGGTQHSELMYFDGSYRKKEKFIYRTRIAPSSHYKIIFMVDTDKGNNGSITFNFSIPKYFYGHNIAQAVKNTNEIDFSMFTNHSTIEYHTIEGHERLKRYIKTFFDWEFPACHLDWTCIELKRLDFCYNQIFLTKGIALSYLELQREIRKKHLREDSTQCNNYHTAIHYSNKDYAVKIYHKGSEYTKNDRKEHEKINRNKNKPVFDVDYLQEVSDRILRYEITIRPSYMSYLYNSNIFRKDSSQFQTWKKIFNKVRAVRTKNDKKDFSSYKELYESYWEIHEAYKYKKIKGTGQTMFEWLKDYYAKGEKTEKGFSPYSFYKLISKFHDDFNSLINTRRGFFFLLGAKDRNEMYNDNQSNDNKFDTVKVVKFSDKMYRLMAGKLYEFIKDMAVEKKKGTQEYLDAIDAYNKEIDDRRKMNKGLPSCIVRDKSKISKTKLGVLLYALESTDLETLRKKGVYNKSTYYNYKADLKKIGYTKNTISYCEIQSPEIDFRTYFIECFTNSDKMFNDPLFKLEPLERK